MAFGSFQSHRPHSMMSDINVTPMVAVMLVLLVIFIITAPMLTSSVKLELPAAGLAYAQGAATLAGAMSRDEQVIRVLRQAITRSTHRIEGGLTMLASIGATAPFVGLLGTVWGIYHALSTVSTEGIVQIDKVAGPVGEALIMTAFGLLVAIPAVLAYNALNRLNRVTLAELDGFAHDLHAYFTK